MNDSYITVTHRSREEISISRSRFISYAFPCVSEKEALSFLQEIRNEHKTATHHCFAYIIGENSGIMRYSDDGEPGGTAGLPIMDVIRLRNVVNCCIVVVRYFGGTLLGTGGLVRAYTQSAQAAINAAGIIRMEQTCVFQCELSYSVWDKFRYAAEHLPVTIEDIQYSSFITFRLLFRSRDKESVIDRLRDATDRTLKLIPSDEQYCAWMME